MFMPKVKFYLAQMKNEAINLSRDCFPVTKIGRSWRDYIFRFHPTIKEDLDKAKTRKGKTKIIRNYTEKFWKSELEQLKTQKNLFQKEWNKVNDGYMKALSEVLETSWPKNRKTIYATVSINPICLRFLKYWTIQIFYMQRFYEMRGIVAEDILHFLYFKKWKEVFPDADEKTFNEPHLEWALSEILVPAIIGDKRIWKIIHSIPEGHSYHRKVKIGKRNLIQHFENLYKESRKKKEPFAQFLQTAYKEAKKHKDNILKA